MFDVVQHHHPDDDVRDAWCITDTNRPGRCIPFGRERTALEVAIDIQTGRDSWDSYLECNHE